jgi:protein O-mannosyl-transferase
MKRHDQSDSTENARAASLGQSTLAAGQELSPVSPQPTATCRKPAIGPSVAVCGFLLLVVALIFGRTVGYDFVNYDDHDYVYNNPHLAHGLNAEEIRWAFTTDHCNNWHPLTWLSYFVDYQLCGPNPWGYHLTNVLLHAATVILLFLVLWRLTGDFWPSAFVAAVFAIHPLRAESVAWVSERKDVLSGLFFMLTLGAYMGYVRHPFSLLRYLAVVVLFALGLMAKPMLVTLPFVLLLLDYWPLGRMALPATDGLNGTRRFPRLAWLVVEKLPLLALTIGSCVLTFRAQRDAMLHLSLLTIYERIPNAAVSCMAYVGQLFYPAGLVAFYPYPADGWPLWQVAGSMVLLTYVCLAVPTWRRRCPYFFVGWFWYLGMLVPVIGLVQVGGQSMADRYTYLPQIGLAIGLAWGAKRVLALRPQRAWLGGVVGAATVAVLMGCAWQQTSHWRSSEALWSHAVQCDAQNARAYSNLAMALVRDGRVNEAIDCFNKSLEIAPDQAEIINNLGLALTDCGRLNEGIVQYEKALKLKPDLEDVNNNYGEALLQKGIIDEAIAHFEKALKVKPDFARAHHNLGMALAMRGRANEAVGHFLKALELQPDYAETHGNLAIALAECGQFDEAIDHCEQALKLKPDYAKARQILDFVLSRREEVRKTVAGRRELLGSRPDDLALLNDTAWTLATTPNASLRNGAEAVALAGRAVQLSDGRDPAVLDTMAAAYAEAGRFPEALQTAHTAAKLAVEQSKQPLAESIKAKISLYEAHTPFHETPLPPTTGSTRP